MGRGSDRKKGSDYYKGIDTEKVVFGGHSCGGAQTLANCADKHVKTCIMFNSGMGNISMADASKESLKNLHGPILYIAEVTVTWPMLTLK